MGQQENSRTFQIALATNLQRQRRKLSIDGVDPVISGLVALLERRLQLFIFCSIGQCTSNRMKQRHTSRRRKPHWEYDRLLARPQQTVASELTLGSFQVLRVEFAMAFKPLLMPFQLPVR